MKKLNYVGSILLLLSGCTSGEKASSNTVQVKSPEGAIYSADFTKPATSLQAAKMFSASKTATGVRVQGNAEKPSSSGKTAGAFFALPDNIEAEVSGKSVIIQVQARSSSSDSLRIAYSTNEVGNSGWKTFKLDPKFKTYKFEYSVEKLEEGRGDFLGFAPRGEAEIASFSILAK